MALRIFAVAATCLAVLQDPAVEIERAILQLSNDDPQVRLKAETALMAFGPKAIPALREASQGIGAVTRENAKRILAELERIEFEKAHDAENRKTGLKRFLEWHDRDDSKESYPHSVEGVVFRCPAKTLAGGLVVLPKFYASDRVLDYALVSATTPEGKALAFETCTRCDCSFIPHPGPVKVRFKGRRQWFSLYVLDFKDPREGQKRRVGDFVFMVGWPQMKVSPLQPCPESLEGSTTTEYSFTLKGSDTKRLSVMHRDWDSPGKGWLDKGAYSREKWCPCKAGPTDETWAEEKKITSWSIKSRPEEKLPERLDLVDSLRILFWKPMEESFETDLIHVTTSGALPVR